MGKEGRKEERKKGKKEGRKEAKNEGSTESQIEFIRLQTPARRVFARGNIRPWGTVH